MALLTHVPVKHVVITFARPRDSPQDPAVFAAVLGNCLVAKLEQGNWFQHIDSQERQLFWGIRSVNLVNYSGRQFDKSIKKHIQKALKMQIP